MRSKRKKTWKDKTRTPPTKISNFELFVNSDYTKIRVIRTVRVPLRNKAHTIAAQHCKQENVSCSLFFASLEGKKRKRGENSPMLKESVGEAKMERTRRDERRRKEQGTRAQKEETKWGEMKKKWGKKEEIGKASPLKKKRRRVEEANEA